MNPFKEWLWAAKLAIVVGVVLLGFQLFGTRVRQLLVPVVWLPTCLVVVGYCAHVADRARNFRNGRKYFASDDWLTQKMFWVMTGLFPNPFWVLVLEETLCGVLAFLYFFVASLMMKLSWVLGLFVDVTALFFVLLGMFFFWMTLDEARRRREEQVWA